MRYNSETHHRQSIRLRGWDYTKDGAYYVTLCSREKELLFGSIDNGKMVLNDIGQVVRDALSWLIIQYEYIQLAEWVIMPNHAHLILVMESSKSSKKIKPLGRIIGAFKTVSTKKINVIRQTQNSPVWQRNYYEHIIRNEKSFFAISEYIRNNPAAWEDDEYFG